METAPLVDATGRPLTVDADESSTRTAAHPTGSATDPTIVA